MKKIICLILVCLSLSGCYNYLELENIAIVSLMQIDYHDDEFYITLEIRENIKDEENASIMYSSHGPSLNLALENMSISVNKVLYLIDLDTLVLTTNALNNEIDNIMDYLTRVTITGSNYLLVVSDDDPEKYIKIINDKDKIAGDYIKETINTYYNNIVSVNYNEFIKTYLNPYYDIILPYARLDEDNFILDKAVILDKNKIKDQIDFKDVQIYNLLSNNNNHALIDIKYNDEQLVYKVSDSKVKINYDDNKYKIKFLIVGAFDEMENINLDDEKVLDDLVLVLEDSFNKQTSSLIDTFIKNNSDILGFRKIFYNKTRNKLDDIKNIKYDLDIIIKIDREGTIFNSVGDKNEKN